MLFHKKDLFFRNRFPDFLYKFLSSACRNPYFYTLLVTVEIHSDIMTLCGKCPNTEFFLVCIFPYSD